MTKSPVETGKVDANEEIGPPIHRQINEGAKQPPEFAVVTKRLQSDHGVLRHVERKINTSALHLHTARAEELCVAPMFFQNRAQFADEFRREQIAAWLPGDHHDAR